MNVDVNLALAIAHSHIFSLTVFSHRRTFALPRVFTRSVSSYTFARTVAPRIRFFCALPVRPSHFFSAAGHIIARSFCTRTTPSPCPPEVGSLFDGICDALARFFISLYTLKNLLCHQNVRKQIQGSYCSNCPSRLTQSPFFLNTMASFYRDKSANEKKRVKPCVYQFRATDTNVLNILLPVKKIISAAKS